VPAKQTPVQGKPMLQPLISVAAPVQRPPIKQAAVQRQAIQPLAATPSPTQAAVQRPSIQQPVKQVQQTQPVKQVQPTVQQTQPVQQVSVSQPKQPLPAKQVRPAKKTEPTVTTQEPQHELVAPKVFQPSLSGQQVKGEQPTHQTQPVNHAAPGKQAQLASTQKLQSQQARLDHPIEKLPQPADQQLSQASSIPQPSSNKQSISELPTLQQSSPTNDFSLDELNQMLSELQEETSHLTLRRELHAESGKFEEEIAQNNLSSSAQTVEETEQSTLQADQMSEEVVLSNEEQTVICCLSLTDVGCCSRCPLRMNIPRTRWNSRQTWSLKMIFFTN
jgi:hypothetical protein